MITKFDSLFAGHIDMENAGYAGAAVNDRRFPNERLATVFDKAEAMARLIDRLGYSAFWMAEDYATADILTGGRVIFGVGRGYHTREVETFGAPLLDQPANRELFEEQVE